MTASMIAKSVLFAARQNPSANRKNVAAKTNLTFIEIKANRIDAETLRFSCGARSAFNCEE